MRATSTNPYPSLLEDGARRRAVAGAGWRCEVPMQLEVWSDVVCPWCYIGKRRLEAALQRFDGADEVRLRWRSFELDPSAPPVREGSVTEHLATKYGIDRSGAERMQEQMTAVAAEEGLAYRFGEARLGRSFDAHRLLHLAADRGCQSALKERLMAAAFTEGAAIGEASTLAQLAGEVGLDAGEVDEVLGGSAYADAVRADESDAARLGITAVPTFVVERSVGVAGAQPAEVLASLLERGRELIATEERRGA